MQRALSLAPRVMRTFMHARAPYRLFTDERRRVGDVIVAFIYAYTVLGSLRLYFGCVTVSLCWSRRVVTGKRIANVSVSVIDDACCARASPFTFLIGEIKIPRILSRRGGNYRVASSSPRIQRLAARRVARGRYFKIKQTFNRE